MRLVPGVNNSKKTSPCQPVWVGEGFFFCALGLRCPDFRSIPVGECVTTKAEVCKPMLSMAGPFFSPARSIGYGGSCRGRFGGKRSFVRGFCCAWGKGVWCPDYIKG